MPPLAGPLAVGTNIKLGYVEETTHGTVPASPLKLLRATTVTPRYTISSTQSAELTTAREVADLIRTDAKGGLSFNHELSYKNVDGPLESLFGAHWASDVLKVGTTKITHTTELQFSDIGQYCAYKYSLYNDFSISVAKGKIIDGSMGFVSLIPVWDDASVGTGGPTAAETNSVMDPVGSVQLIQEGGAGSVSGPSEFSIHLSNGIIDFPQLADLDPASLEYGQLKAEGTLSMYFADRTLLDKALAWDDTSLLFSLGGASGKLYDFSFARVKLSNMEVTGIAVNSAVILRSNWQALSDPTDTTAKITRYNVIS